MTRQELRDRFPLHNQASLRQGFIPPAVKSNRRKRWEIVRYWATVTFTCMVFGFVVMEIALAWLRGA
jgi:hypothetical protein